MPYLPRVSHFPIVTEKSLVTTQGTTFNLPCKERQQHEFIGKRAPEIFLKDHLGRPVSLDATIALGRPIILFFFPLAGSPFCTMESCSFRDALRTSAVFSDMNAVIIGISQDSPSRTKKFIQEHQLGFRILHDQQRETFNSWGVGRCLFGLIDSRMTFIIDHKGLVRSVLEGVFNYKGHLDFAEKWLIRLEHELVGRKRLYNIIDDDDHHQAAIESAAEPGQNVGIVYGEKGSEFNVGIGSQPRFGAAAAKIPPANWDFKKKLRSKIKEWFSPTSIDYDEPLQFEQRLSVRKSNQQDRTKFKNPLTTDDDARQGTSSRSANSQNHLTCSNISGTTTETSDIDSTSSHGLLGTLDDSVAIIGYSPRYSGNHSFQGFKERRPNQQHLSIQDSIYNVVDKQGTSSTKFELISKSTSLTAKNFKLSTDSTHRSVDQTTLPITVSCLEKSFTSKDLPSLPTVLHRDQHHDTPTSIVTLESCSSELTPPSSSSSCCHTSKIPGSPTTTTNGLRYSRPIPKQSPIPKYPPPPLPISLSFIESDTLNQDTLSFSSSHTQSLFPLPPPRPPRHPNKTVT